MLFINKLLTNALPLRVLVNNLEIPENYLYLTLVRWRKRRWSPRAPSKMYVVRQPTLIEPERAQEIKRKYDIYRTEMKSMRDFVTQQYWAEQARLTGTLAQAEAAQEFASLMEINAEWNADTAKLRDTREVVEAKQKEEELLATLTKNEEEDRTRKEHANMVIQREMEASKSFITLENLDTEIEKALDNPKNYNFVVDNKGGTFVETSDGSLQPVTEEVDEETGEKQSEESSAQSN